MIRRIALVLILVAAAWLVMGDNEAQAQQQGDQQGSS